MNIQYYVVRSVNGLNQEIPISPRGEWWNESYALIGGAA